MRVIAHRTLVKFYTNRPDSKTAIENWFTKSTSAAWPRVLGADVKKDFNSVDNVGNQHTIFNIKGNDYRLVVVIKFQIKMIYIRFIGTHNEYNKIDCFNI